MVVGDTALVRSLPTNIVDAQASMRALAPGAVDSIAKPKLKIQNGPAEIAGPEVITVTRYRHHVPGRAQGRARQGCFNATWAQAACAGWAGA